MPITADFDFIHAKVHGLRSRVYERDRLDGLCDLTRIAQLWHRLYPQANAADHLSLQRRLLADHIETLRGVRNHLPAALEPFFSWMLRRYQVENLKVLVRAWKARATLDEVAAFLAPLPRDLELPAAALLKTRSLADFLLLIPEPAFRKAGEASARHYIEREETFFIETPLEAAYYRGLLAAQETLRGLHRQHTTALVRLEVAIYNILALFRLKLSYAMSYADASRFFVPLAPHAFRLERLYDYPDFSDMAKLIPREFLPKQLGFELKTIADLERAFWQRLLQVANRQFYRSTSDFGAVVSFVTIKRVELANVIRVIEGVRYGMDAESIRAGLIQVAQPVSR